jgi:hypothetical protein
VETNGSPSKRERIILYGVIPILSAIVGALATYMIARYLGGGDHPSEVMVEILKTPNLSPADKARLMTLANVNTERFYSFLGYLSSVLMLVCGVLVWAVADWIRKR